jgi:hypothetical protein
MTPETGIMKSEETSIARQLLGRGITIVGAVARKSLVETVTD